MSNLEKKDVCRFLGENFKPDFCKNFESKTLLLVIFFYQIKLKNINIFARNKKRLSLKKPPPKR